MPTRARRGWSGWAESHTAQRGSAVNPTDSDGSSPIVRSRSSSSALHLVELLDRARGRARLHEEDDVDVQPRAHLGQAHHRLGEAPLLRDLVDDRRRLVAHGGCGAHGQHLAQALGGQAQRDPQVDRGGEDDHRRVDVAGEPVVARHLQGQRHPEARQRADREQGVAHPLRGLGADQVRGPAAHPAQHERHPDAHRGGDDAVDHRPARVDGPAAREQLADPADQRVEAQARQRHRLDRDRERFVDLPAPRVALVGPRSRGPQRPHRQQRQRDRDERVQPVEDDHLRAREQSPDQASRRRRRSTRSRRASALGRLSSRSWRHRPGCPRAHAHGFFAANRRFAEARVLCGAPTRSGPPVGLVGVAA